MTKERRMEIKLAALGQELMEPAVDERKFFECESLDCAFNKDGECRYYAVEEELPVLTEESGCLSGIIPDPYSD